MSLLWKRVFEKWKRYNYEVHRNELKSAAAQGKAATSRKRRCKGRELFRSHTVGLIPVYRVIADPCMTSEFIPSTQPLTRHGSIPTDHRVMIGKGAMEKLGISDVTGPAWQDGGRPDSLSLDVTNTSNYDVPAKDDVRADTASRVPPYPTQLFYTTPPLANMVKQGEKKLEGESRNDGRGWARLSRRLSYKDRIKQRNSNHHLRQRSASIDCAEGRRSRLSADLHPASGDVTMTVSRDHFTDMNPSPSPSPQSAPKSSPSPQSWGRRGSEWDVRQRTIDRRGPSRIAALFSAVEQQDMELVLKILDGSCIDVNTVNDDTMTVLDVAVLTNNIPIAKILLSHGAKQSPVYHGNSSISENLEKLINNAEKRVVDLTAAVLSNPGHVTAKEHEKGLAHWQFRYRLLKRMKAGYDQSRVPDAPGSLILTVMSSSSILAKFEEPFNHNGAVVTHYKVEWSCFEDFTPASGEDIVEDVGCLQYEIRGLVTGNRYYIRVYACNMKGYSAATYADPTTYAVPSSWRDIEGFKPRCYGKSKLLEELFSQLKHCRPSDATIIKDHAVKCAESPAPRKRKSLKNLFASAPKLQKSLKRGIYLACVFFNDDRLLVTADDQLPFIEVDENFTGPSIQADFHWLMKISCTWDDIASLKQDMDKSGVTGPSMHVRCKILNAVSLLQSALGIGDLGRFYHRPVKDLSGCTVLATINHIKDPKLINLISGKWLAINKLRRRFSLASPTMNDARHVVLQTLPDMLSYHQSSNMSLSPGLYLGYLKLQSSVDTIRVLVPKLTPNVLPHTLVRDCPNVSREEWEWIQQLSQEHCTKMASPTQRRFHEQITLACRRLLSNLGVCKNPDNQCHRLYDLEVIELSPDVSFLLLLPPTEQVCVVPGQVDELTERAEYMTLPVQVFEMIHMHTYHTDIMRRYYRLSCIVDLDLYLAQHAHREAFSNDELSKAKKRLDELGDLQQSLDKIWKNTRWIMDVISYARDKTIKSSLTLGVLTEQKRTFADSSPTMDAQNNNDIRSSMCDNRCVTGTSRTNLRITNFYDPNEESRLSPLSPLSPSVPNRLSPSVSPSTSHRLSPSVSQCSSTSSSSSPGVQRITQAGILRVYAAYETGLAKGTSVKLHVTPRTSSREVINLVVQQLNKALTLKGRTDPVYPPDKLDLFCLVVTIGARERVLRDDYQPLQLQNPWTKGRLYVRMKCNVLAAIEQGHETYT